MSKGLSSYLDLVRFSAAAAVFLHHLLLTSGCYAPGGADCSLFGLQYPLHAGHSAVILFFVLSGYVITYVATEREQRFRDYSLSRIARIYSVAVPVLVLVILLDVYAWLNEPDGTISYQYRKLWLYVPLALTFTTDHWFLAEDGLTHAGWWSLSYEVWYYVLFAAAFYSRGWKQWVLTVTVLLVMGPKLVALLPCWLLGSLVYRMHHDGITLTAGWAKLIVLFTSLSVCLAIFLDALHGLDTWTNAVSNGWLSTQMRYSQWFVGDLVLASIFAANIFAAKFAEMHFGVLARPIKFLASFTFIFYMAHGPLLAFSNKHFHFGFLSTAAFVAIGSFLLGLITERQKARFQHVIARLIDRAALEFVKPSLMGIPRA